MRGIAILGVIFCHWIGDPFAPELRQISEPLAKLALAPGHHGVDLFFVISGWLIGGIVIREHTAHNFARVFFARRALRILPLYLLCLAIFWPLIAEFRANLDQPPPLWSYLTFTHNWFQAADSQPLVVISAYWSLAVEEQFYFAVAALALLFGTRGILVLAVALMVLGPIFRITGTWPHVLFSTLGRADPIGLGVLLAWLPAGAGRRLCVIWLVLAALMLDRFAGASALAGLAISYRAHPIVARVTTVAWLPAVGRMCFSLYLTHEFFRVLAVVIIGDRPGPVALLVTFAAMVNVCWALERWVAAPFMRIGHRLRY